MRRSLQAPAESGAVLAVPSFDTVASALDANRGLLNRHFSELRRLARRELQINADVPLVVTGHQPEFCHPGVWLKNFAACGTARRIGGHALNLIVDTDTLKRPSLPLPDDERATLPFDAVFGEVPYESRAVNDDTLWHTLGTRLTTVAAKWPFTPVGLALHFECYDSVNLGERITQLRVDTERAWGCHNRELTVSALSRLEAFRAFVGMIAADAARFRSCYNSALDDYRRVYRVRSRNHPAANLGDGELPFWTIRGTERLRTFAVHDVAALRPKALLLTLFVRLILGDYFIHGLGGGKYDRATDTIVRTFFGIEPPQFQIVTGTLRLPFPGPRQTQSDLHALRHTLRDWHWNPQRHVQNVKVQQRHRAIVHMSQATRSERRQRYRAFQELLQESRPLMREEKTQLEHLAGELVQEVRQHNQWNRRDFAWILYPEAILKPFLTQKL